jgi:hypothetical protein
MNQHLNLWALIESDLTRARHSLPDAAANDTIIREYQEFIDHNELELACDILEAYAEDQMVSKDFWLGLRDAPKKMKLPDHAARYERNISNRDSL